MTTTTNTTTVTVAREQLASAMQWGAAASAKRTTLPVLKCARLTVSGSTLTVEATDLDTWVKVRVPANVEGEGAICLDAKRLSDIAQAVSGPISLSWEDKSAILKSGRSRFSLAGIASDEFPEAPNVLENGTPIALPATAFAEAAKRAAPFCQYGGMSVWNGACLTRRDGRAVFVGCDGHRAIETELTPIALYEGAYLIPATSLPIIAKLAGMAEGSVTLRVTPKDETMNGWLGIEQGEVSIATKLMNDQYPNHALLFAKASPVVATVDSSALSAMVQRVSLASGAENHRMEMTWADGEVRAEVVNTQQAASAVDQCPCDLVGAVSIAFNHRMFGQLLAAIPGERVELRFSDNKNAVIALNPDDPTIIGALAPLYWGS